MRKEWSDAIVSEEGALERVRSRKRLSIDDWLECSPFIRSYIERKGLTNEQAALDLNRSRSAIVSFKKVAQWPRAVVSQVQRHQHTMTVADLNWLLTRKLKAEEILERIEAHAAGAQAIPSRPKPKFTRMGAVPHASADEAYLTEQIRGSCRFELEGIYVDTRDPIIRSEVMRRLKFKR